MTILSEIQARFRTALAALGVDPAPYVGMVRPAHDARFGDYQANFAMPLSAALGKKQNSRGVAEDVVARLDVADLCHPPEIAGPGFINLTLRDEMLNNRTAALVPDARLGVEPAQPAKNIVIDFSAPNVAKPMHVGHLRSSVIGDALYRILKFQGHAVRSDNHIGDWGTQFGMIIFGYKHFLDADAYKQNAVGELARLYRLVNQLSDYHELVAKQPALAAEIETKQREVESAEASAKPDDKADRKRIAKLKSDLAELKQSRAAAEARIAEVNANPALKPLADRFPDIAVAAREETARLHAGDAENLRLWSEFVPKCLEALDAVYARLEIHFDMTLGESYYQPQLAAVVQNLGERGIARVSEGATCVFLEGNTAPFIIQKTNGAFTYATTDLATIQYRVDTLHADAIYYVVDARQAEHFSMLFETARLWGYGTPEMRHVSFGTVLGEDKRPFKTRAGDTVGLESLLDEAVLRARQVVDENDDAKESPELDSDARAAVAEIVGIGGIKYADLRHNRDSDYVFSWDKMLAKNGDTATYMQYAVARICGIFRKGGIDRGKLHAAPVELRLTHPSERALALQLCRFAEAIEVAGAELRPNMLTAYLFDTANAFSTLYQEVHVLSEQNETLRTSRLLLCDLTARVLELGLSLLGIKTAERM